MTCIVALVQNGTVYMGADSAGASGYNLSVRADTKVFENGPFLIGFTTSFRMGQLLQYAFQPPPHPEELGNHAYMVTTFVDAVRQCFKDGGFSEKQKEAEIGGTFLTAYRGKIYSIQEDYQVGESLDAFNAVGCGADIALGSLYSTMAYDPFTRLKTALQAAERYSAGVCGPYTIIKQSAP